MLPCLFVSLLSHFRLIHSFYLHLLYQPYVGLCQATCVQSHQRQPTSAVAIATCEVQVSAADSHTVPTVATWVSKPLCCRLTLTFALTSENLSLYITVLLLLVVIQLCSPCCPCNKLYYFYWSLYNYAAHAARAINSIALLVVIQLCSPCCPCENLGCSVFIANYNVSKQGGMFVV